MISENDHRYIWHPFSSWSAEPDQIPVVKGKAEFLYDEQGRTYIDAISSWWVNIHGHSHPYINQKIAEQLAELEHVIFSGFTHTPAVTLAERLVQKAGGGRGKIFFSDNGSTSVEVALKLAIQFWKNRGEQRTVFIAFEGSYHGDTFGSMSVSERDVFTQAFEKLLFHVEYIPLPTQENIHEVRNKLAAILEEQRVAAFIYEPLVQGAGGMRMYAAEYLQQLMSLVRQQGVLCIADEVMTGFGRTGTFFASDRVSERPDMLCMSKALTGGYLPMGATWVNEQILTEFKQATPERTFYHGHSFTGNPIACAAANASLDLLGNAVVQQGIEELEFRMVAMAEEFSQHPQLQDVRVCGTILAMDVRVPDEGYFYTHPVKKILYDTALENGVLLRPMGNLLYVLPPYCIREESLEQIRQTLYKCLEKTE